MMKLNLGSGTWLKPGWVNVDGDKNSHAEVIHDLRTPLPWSGESVDYVFMEHFFEHIKQSDGQKLLFECWRVLKWGGVIRINGPDLMNLAKLYVSRRYDIWRDMVTGPGDTICDFMNDVFYSWEHRYIPDLPQLTYMLQKAQFRGVVPCAFRKSTIPELCDLEVRSMSWTVDTVVEAIK